MASRREQDGAMPTILLNESPETSGITN